MLGVSPSIRYKLISCEVIFKVFQPMWSISNNITDGQTDRQTDNMQSQDRTLHYSASHSKNWQLTTSTRNAKKMSKDQWRQLKWCWFQVSSLKWWNGSWMWWKMMHWYVHSDWEEINWLWWGSWLMAHQQKQAVQCHCSVLFSNKKRSCLLRNSQSYASHHSPW